MQIYQPKRMYLIIVISYILLQLIILNSRTQRVSNTVKQWISSEAIHVVITLVIVFLVIFILSYLEIVEDLSLILSAEILARLDLKQKGLNQLQMLVVLTLCLTLGLAIGWMADKLVA